MKVIDLLNKVAKEEEVPKKIKYNQRVYQYDEQQSDYGYFFINSYMYFLDEINTIEQLNDEVEIIGEDKEIEEIPYHYNLGYIDCGDLKREVVEELSNNFNYFAKKINELIKAVNELNKRDK